MTTNMKLNFSISEFCIRSGDVPIEIADKILNYHILPLQEIRDRIDQPIVVSMKAGYRPLDYEINKGRLGNSQHCFKGKGAVDLRYTPQLLDELKENSPYKRVCYYPNNGFVHVDYNSNEDGTQYFECESPKGKWEFKGYV